MVDWTTIGVAALGLVGTLGAGVVGFSGPSWNDQRIQRVRDRRDLRRAGRLVSVEIWEACHVLKAVAGRSIERLVSEPLRIELPEKNETQWVKHRDTLAMLLEDQEDWRAAAVFYSVLDDIRDLAALHALLFLAEDALAPAGVEEDSEDSDDPESTREVLAERLRALLNRVIPAGQNTQDRLDSVLGATNTPHVRGRGGS